MEERAAVFQLQLLFVLVVWFVGGWPPAQRLEAGFSVVVGGGGVGGGGGSLVLAETHRPTFLHLLK